VALETWYLYGCYLSAVNYGEANYGTNEPMQIEMTIRFDNALQSPAGAGVGAVVGRTLGDIATGLGT